MIVETLLSVQLLETNLKGCSVELGLFIIYLGKDHVKTFASTLLFWGVICDVNLGI